MIGASIVVLFAALWAGYGSPEGPVQCRGSTAPASKPVRHVFFIVKENHAFENYFATLPGTIDYSANLSLPSGGAGNRSVRPFPLPGYSTQDLPHDRASDLAAWDQGRNDRFVAVATQDGYPNAAAAVGYYTARQIPGYFAYAHDYSIDDRFFVGSMSPTLPNRIFDIAGTDAGWTTDLAPPPSVLEIPTVLGQLTAACLPWSYLYVPGAGPVAPQLFPALVGSPSIGTADHLASELAAANPPALTILDPSPNSTVSEHPPGNVSTGSDWTVGAVDPILSSPVASSSVVFVFFDESGGFWDPEPPPTVGTTGDGFRVPLLVISPYTPADFIDHSTLDPSSLLKFVDETFRMPYLTPAVAAAPDIGALVNVSTPPRAPVLLPTNFSASFEEPKVLRPSVAASVGPQVARGAAVSTSPTSGPGFVATWTGPGRPAPTPVVGRAPMSPPPRAPA